jgi:phospholipid/cholesterol/gamma-HCH transport system permease protein
MQKSAEWPLDMPRWSLSSFNSVVRLDGSWTLTALAGRLNDVTRSLAEYGLDSHLTWDLTGISQLDTLGALMIWRAWGRQRPSQVRVKPEHERVLQRVAQAPHARPRRRDVHLLLDPLEALGQQEAKLAGNTLGMLELIGSLVQDFLRLLLHPGSIPWKEISASIYKAGGRALPVTALVGFLIGIVVSYLSALTLRTYGAGLYIIDILGISIIRELGPLLVAILLAGRSGSAMTAQIGVMRVTEEIDAIKAMGISPTLRLVFPKVIGLALAMPLVSFWAICAALVGGWVAAYALLGISLQFFFQALPGAVHPANLWIAVLKSVTFGAAISLTACHFGLRVKPNTESVSAGITASVVTSITVMIVIDAVYAIAFHNIGFLHG